MKVLITDHIHQEGIKLLRNSGFSVDEKYDLSKDDLKKIIGNYEALIVRSKTKVTREVIEAGNKLLVIGRAGVGLDNIDVNAAKEKNIKVINTPDVSTVSVAELVMGFMISAARFIPQATESLKKGEWEKEKFMGMELSGKTLGIVGLGRIGKALAKRAMAFDMTVIGYDPYVKSDENIKMVDLETLLKNSDFISFHVPLTDETKHMISSKEIEKMKKGVILINAARGGILDEIAIKKGMDEGIIKAVCLDVFESEKPFNTILTSEENFIGTPHIGAQTEEAQQRAGIEISKKIIEFLKGIKG
ncbi:MAG: hydroxyacid dehydrogenase [Thermoplasmata archaeon]|nr:hydroxyacid dehydrogenase [Thermoplasmata archaeon]